MEDYFDKELMSKIKNEPITIPSDYYETVEKTLLGLEYDSKKVRKSIYKKFFQMAAVLAVCLFVILPNVSYEVAMAMEEFPFIGNFIHAITLRNYEVDDEFHQMKARIPMVSVDENNISQEVANVINKKIIDDTKPLIDEFYEEMESIGKDGHTGLFIDYEEMTNNEKWYSLKLILCRTSGGGSVEYRFYNVDKATGKLVPFKDLIKSEEHKKLIQTNIKNQMMKINEKEKYPIYWEEDVILTDNQNYYFNDEEELVIVFNEYEVAPGAYGCPEFKITGKY